MILERASFRWFTCPLLRTWSLYCKEMVCYGMFRDSREREEREEERKGERPTL